MRGICVHANTLELIVEVEQRGICYYPLRLHDLRLRMSNVKSVVLALFLVCCDPAACVEHGTAQTVEPGLGVCPH